MEERCHGNDQDDCETCDYERYVGEGSVEMSTKSSRRTVSSTRSEPDDVVIAAYRTREEQLRKRLAEIRECPFCGNATGGEATHEDGCELGPVEVCGQRIQDTIMGGTYPCRMRAVHKGACR